MTQGPEWLKAFPTPSSLLWAVTFREFWGQVMICGLLLACESIVCDDDDYRNAVANES